MSNLEHLKALAHGQRRSTGLKYLIFLPLKMQVQAQLNEKDKQIAKATQDLKAQADDGVLREKELKRETDRLTEENKRLQSEGAAQLAVRRTCMCLV